MTRWVRTAAGAVLFLLWSGAAAAQEGRWLRAETPQFIVYSDGSERTAREAVEDLESFDALLRLLTQPRATGPQQRLEVYMFRSGAMLARVRPGMPQAVFGFYIANTEALSMFAVLRSGASLDERHTLYHEYAHHFMYQNFPTAYPSWYTEGFAEYVSTADITADRTEYGKFSEMRALWLAEGRWLPLERILTERPLGLSSTDAAMFYAQSWLLTHYVLSSDQTRAAFRAYARALQSEGVDPAASFFEAFQTNSAQLERTLRQHVRRLPYITLTGWAGAQHAPLTFTRLPAAADAIVPLVARLRAGLVNPNEMDAFAASLRAAAAPYPEDPFVQTALARVELETGAYQRAREILTPVLAANPNSHEPNYLMGAAHLAEGRINTQADIVQVNLQARRYLTRAAGLDRRHAPTLYRYAQAAWTDPSQAENAFDVLMEARALAPQVSEVALNAAVELMRRGRHADAANILRPLAYDPHANAAALRPVRELLAQAEAHGAPEEVVSIPEASP